MHKDSCVRINHWKFALVILASAVAGTAACADGSGDPAVASSDSGKYADKGGNPTYKVSEDGTVDWYTYSGFRRYHSDCHVCHGPNGEGSSYAPALAESLKTLNYTDFAEVVTNGRKNVDVANDKVMPTFADNVNVMCFLDDIYVYLRARANGAIPGGRPPRHEDKPEAAKQAETSCTGIK
jgi:methanol metabolism-related c-type cytochrome